MAVPPVLADLVSTPHAPNRSGRGGRTATQTSTRSRTTSSRLLSDFKLLARKVKPSPEDFVFTSRQGTPFSQQTVQRLVTKACRFAGVRQGTPHEFRRSCITNLLRAGAEFSVVSKGVAGHANPATTMRPYRTVTPAEVGAALDSLSY